MILPSSLPLSLPPFSLTPFSPLSQPRNKVLDKMNELQKLQPEQFEELGLPLAIKHLAWEKDSVLFVRIVSPHADKYLASEFSPKMVLSSQQVRTVCISYVSSGPYPC